MDKYIYFTGPDGVGKTHHIEHLQNKINENTDVAVIWLRFYHLISLPLLAVAKLLGYSWREPSADGFVHVHEFDSSIMLKTIYPPLLFLDTILMWMYLWVYYRSSGKDMIIFDRFLYDTIAQAMVSTGRDDIMNIWYTKLFVKLIPENTTTILLLADAETLKSRRKDVELDPKIHRKVEVYKMMAKKYEIEIVDADNEIQKVEEQVAKLISL